MKHFIVIVVEYGVGGKVSRIVGVSVMFFFIDGYVERKLLFWFGSVRFDIASLDYISVLALLLFCSPQDGSYKLDACAMGADS